jgi:hypothetical protein
MFLVESTQNLQAMLVSMDFLISIMVPKDKQVEILWQALHPTSPLTTMDSSGAERGAR